MGAAHTHEYAVFQSKQILVQVENHTIQHSYINVYLYVLYLLEVFRHNVKSVKRYLLTA